MPKSFSKLMEGNKEWVDRKNSEDPRFFEKLSKGQQPNFLWIGCSDSRVAADEITGAESGEIFVHRNIANMVFQTDMNLLSVLQYSVEVLKVQDILIVGHYGCGGVRAAIENPRLGLIDNWINPIKMAYEDNLYHFMKLETIEEKTNRLVEINVMRQVKNLARTTIMQDAWAAGLTPSIHGLVYDLRDGVLKDLNLTITPNGVVPADFGGLRI